MLQPESYHCIELLPANGFRPAKHNDWPAQYPSVVIAVDDIKASMKKIDDAGGKILGEPMEIPGVGLYVSFFDTEGNRVSMLQPNQSGMSKSKNKAKAK